MNRTQIVEAIGQALSGFKPGIEVLLYGSEARNEARPDSDIDILVLVDKEDVSIDDELIITAPLYDIELKTGVLINVFIMPKINWGKKITPFYENVTRDAIAL